MLLFAEQLQRVITTPHVALKSAACNQLRSEQRPHILEIRVPVLNNNNNNYKTIMGDIRKRV